MNYINSFLNYDRTLEHHKILMRLTFNCILNDK